MSDISQFPHDLQGQPALPSEAPRRRGIAVTLTDFALGIVDSLRRNILLGLVCLASLGAVFRFSIFETSLVLLLLYIVLLMIASLTES